MDQAFAATKRVAEDHEALEMARLDQEILALQYDDDDGGGATRPVICDKQRARTPAKGETCVYREGVCV